MKPWVYALNQEAYPIQETYGVRKWFTVETVTFKEEQSSLRVFRYCFIGYIYIH